MNEAQINNWLQEQLKSEKDGKPKDIYQTSLPPQKLTGQGSRLVVVEEIYHARSNGKELEVPAGYKRFLKTSDQPYGPRELLATPVWQKIDCGWVQKCSLFLIVNQLKADNIDEQEWELGTLELLRSLDDPTSKDIPHDHPELWYLPPEESLRGVPGHLGSLWVRSRKSEVPYTITVIPE